MYVFRQDPGRDAVGVAFSDAVAPGGGVLTLGGAHGSDGRPAGVAAVAASLGIELALVRQVHGVGVAIVTPDRPAAAVPEADALVTTRPGIGLTVRVADCVPVLLADAEHGVIGAAHAGRAGLGAGVLQQTVARMWGLGANRITGWIGPHICGRCYEVPAAMAEAFEAALPGTRSVTGWGTPSIDLAAGVRRVLDELGVDHSTVPGCTREQSSLHSHRRDAAAAGRQAGIIWLAGACRAGDAG